MLSDMKRLRPAWLWVVGGAVVVAIGIGATVTLTGAARADRDERFLEALRADETTSVGDLPEAQLLHDLDETCAKIANGWTSDDELDEIDQRWAAMKGTSTVPEWEFSANGLALFHAAEVAC